MSPILSLVAKCKEKKKRASGEFFHEFGQVKEADRKFEKICDITHLLRNIQKANLLANSMFTHE